MMENAGQTALTSPRSYPSLTAVLTAAAMTGAVGAAVRYGLIELAFFRDRCQVDVLPWWCWPREAMLRAFDLWILGGISLACAVYALVKPEPTRAALLAVVFGALGLALYNAGPAAIGLVFGLVTVARYRA
jgi:hypothetical protein